MFYNRTGLLNLFTFNLTGDILPEQIRAYINTTSYMWAWAGNRLNGVQVQTPSAVNYLNLTHGWDTTEGEGPLSFNTTTGALTLTDSTADGTYLVLWGGYLDAQTDALAFQFANLQQSLPIPSTTVYRGGVTLAGVTALFSDGDPYYVQWNAVGGTPAAHKLENSNLFVMRLV